MGNIYPLQNVTNITDNLNQNSTESATTSVLPFAKKRDVAAMLQMSVRSVDNFIQEGCPVVKLSARCCRFDLVEVKEWVKNRYGQQSRKRFDDTSD